MDGNVSHWGQFFSTSQRSWPSHSDDDSCLWGPAPLSVSQWACRLYPLLSWSAGGMGPGVQLCQPWVYRLHPLSTSSSVDRDNTNTCLEEFLYRLNGRPQVKCLVHGK